MLDVKIFLYMLAGFFWGGLTAPISIRLAGIYGIIDVPDARKIHKGNMPRGAGIGLWLGYMLMAVIMAGEFPNLRHIATGATVIFLCGYLDDMCSLSPFLRLGLHLGASAFVVIPLDFGIPVTILAVIWLAGVTSAYNLIDGMNGLCISIFIASSIALFMLGRSYPGIYMGGNGTRCIMLEFPFSPDILGGRWKHIAGIFICVPFHYVIGGSSACF